MFEKKPDQEKTEGKKVEEKVEEKIGNVTVDPQGSNTIPIPSSEYEVVNKVIEAAAGHYCCEGDPVTINLFTGNSSNNNYYTQTDEGGDESVMDLLKNIQDDIKMMKDSSITKPQEKDKAA